MKKFELFLLALLLPLLANAYDACINGIYYNFSENMATVTYREDVFFNSYSNSVVIPEYVTHNGKTYSVTSIGYYAFRSCSALTSVTIPNSVTSIGSSAFYGCSSLTSITIPEYVTSISYSAFRGCSSLTSITIPDGVISIDGSAFKYCSSLTSVTIPESVTSIGNEAFSNCSNLTSINIPYGVTSIGEYTFSNCSSLTSINIPYGVTRIGRYAFEKCSGLTEFYCCAVNVPSAESSSFNNSSIATATLYVPRTSVASYKSASPWNGFGEILPMNRHNLIYIVDGKVYKTLAVASGDAITPEPAPTKEGYTFSGWSEIPATMPDHDVTVTGSFTLNNYTLTYILDGQEYKTSTVAYGTAIIPESAPSKEGYTFSGWSEIPETMPAHDVTVTGSFLKNYTLLYIVDGEVYKAVTVAYSTAIIPEPAPTKEGHTFSGWSEIPATMPAHDVTVTGSFAINSYKLTYKVDGVVYKTSTVVYGTAITPEEEPVKEGYTFSGWSEIPEIMPAHDVTVTGTLTVNNYTLTYKVDGAEYKTLTVAYGTAINPEPAPTKEGHTFSGWGEIPATMPAHDVEVNGTFSINSYKLTYKIDGVVYKTSTIIYGTTITPEPAPTKEGHTFSGWSDIPETMPAHDVEVTGTFTVNKYFLTYLVDGKIYKIKSVAYGISITPEPAPTKEGHTFSGWSEIPSTMPAHDVIVKGSFAINSYKLTYKIDGIVYKASTIVYGTTITPEPAPTKEGHTFSGWSDIPETMPAHDVTVTGSFSINSYTLTYILDGEVYKTSTVVYGTEITPEPALTKEGYTFSGWSEIPETMPASDVVVTGSFTINGYILAYLVDGEEYLTLTIDYGTAITPEDEPTREGYTFSGWSEIPATMPAEDVIVTGSFTINQYILSYILDGKEYKSYELDYSTPITPESVPVKKGMTFSGWGEVPEKMPAHDVTLTGSYSWSRETFDGVTYQVTDTLINYASVIGYDNINGDAEILPTIETGGDTYTVNSIVNNAFKGCTGLSSITISSNVTSIGSYAFSGCSSLSSVTIGKGVTSIGNNAFYNTSPKKVFWLSNTPPNGYQNLVGAVNYVANDRYSYLTNVVVYPYLSSMFEVDGMKYVPVSPSERTCDVIDCAYSIENLNVGETVTYRGISLTIKNIGPYYCYGNTFIKKATVRNQGSVGSHAFAGCTALQTVELGQEITSIGNNAFANCTSITEIQIPKKVTMIEDYVFSGCTGLKTILMDDGETELSLGSNGSNSLFASCPLDSVYIGRDITYPTSSNKGYSPFYRNTTLRLLTIADNETEISTNEFYGCTNLKNVRIGDGMMVIGDRAFSGCSSLEYFAFGFNVKTIGKEVFSDCTALSRLISRAIVPPTCSAQALDDINKWECTLVVPQDHIAAYQQADQWKEFFFIEGRDFNDGIGEVKSEFATREDYYDLNGRKLSVPQKGINIIRNSDGSNRKVLVK